MFGEGFTENDYYKLANACDKLLLDPAATLERIAIPWLHVVNEHPVHLPKYAFLSEQEKGSARANPWHGLLRDQNSKVYKIASLTRNLLRAIPYTIKNGAGVLDRTPPEQESRDVIIVSWLVNEAHIEMGEDFYFGNIQSMLADEGLTSLLVLRNQTGRPTNSLSKRVKRTGPCGRLLLPDAITFAQELKFLAGCYAARKRLGENKIAGLTPFERTIAYFARGSLVSHAVIASLRLHLQISELCKQVKPRAVITLFEGYAWERFVWHGARAADPSILCVGYQHTILQKHAHAIKRSLGRGYDPDLIMTLGDITKNILETSEDDKKIPILTLGTHRRAKSTIPIGQPRLIPAFLVLPEGIESECLYLFSFAFQCAQALPEAQFIFRTHPVLPFERMRSILQGNQELPANVRVSSNQSIDEDFAQAGFILYRGSSTVLYAILAGLKPFYIKREGEMDIDPLSGLLAWRESVGSVGELIERYNSIQLKEAGKTVNSEWMKARDFCDKYAQSLRPEAIGEMMSLTRSA